MSFACLLLQGTRTLIPSDLFNTWKLVVTESSSGPSALSFRRIQEHSDPSLLEDLKHLQLRFPNGEIKNRYLQLIPPTSPERAIEWAESRRCVIEVIQQLFQQNVEPENILLSLSHTKSGALSIGTVRTQNIERIGVDVELSTRKISPQAAKSFLSGYEETFAHILSPLQYWMIKEASYKANPRCEETIIADYQVYPTSEEVKLSKYPNLAFRYKVLEHYEFSLAFAYLKQITSEGFSPSAKAEYS